MQDLRTLPLDRFCNFLWWWMTRNANNQQTIEKMKATLWRPPPSAANKPIDRRSPWAPEAEQAGFAALKAGLGGKPTPAPTDGAAGKAPAPGGRRVPVRPRP